MSTSPAQPATDAPRHAPSFAPTGRDREFAQLRCALERTVRGAGGVVALNGSVGSGRSELLHAFSDFAAAGGARVLVATGSPLERDFPLGVARQIFQSADLDPDDRDEAERLLEDLVPVDPRTRPPSDTTMLRPSVRALNGLCTILLRLAEQSPLVLAVDDRQDADVQSLEFLLYMVRRTRNARVLTLLSSRETMTPPNPFFEVELARQPHHRMVKLLVMTPGQVADVLQDRFGEHTGRRLAAEAHALTGGNPLLVHALLEDQDPEHTGQGLVVGESYRRGLMNCLHRMDPLALRCARGVAVLGGPAEPELLADLLLLAPESLDRAFYLLHASGLFAGGGFRHPTGGGDLLAAVQPEDLAALHRRAAYLLRAAGAGVQEVEQQVRAADGHRLGPWEVVGVPEEPEESEASEAEPESVLEAVVASDGSVDDAVVIHCVPSLPGASAEGGPQDGIAAVKYLFWHGRVDEGVAALDGLGAEGGRRIRPWLDYWYPVLLPPEPLQGAGWSGTEDGLRILGALFDGTPLPDAVLRAEAVLREARLGRTPVESLTAALTVLVYGDRADRAEHWCGPLARRTDVHGDPHAQALFSALLAETALRRGDPRRAEEAARAAFARIRPEHWGVAVGFPLSTMITARTELGRYEDAEAYLALPVPEEMFRTPAGVHYRYARGGYLLAVGRAEEALAEFQACGDALARWGIDHLPGVVPWRLGAARAHLALDRPHAAAAQADRQLADLGPAGYARVRGMTLRVRASAGAEHERAGLLERAVEALEAAGDEAGASEVLAELGRAHHAEGDPGRGRPAERRARQLSSRQLARASTPPSCSRSRPRRPFRTGTRPNSATPRGGWPSWRCTG
ncbi:AAA family ATPase [Streptacidiphilus sp. PAMC 29251]